MRQFLRGWKRKVGCAALVLACVFAAGWVRSLQIRDVASIPFGDFGELGFDSMVGHFSCQMNFTPYASRLMGPHLLGADEAYWHDFPVFPGMVADFKGGLKWDEIGFDTAEEGQIAVVCRIPSRCLLKCRKTPSKTFRPRSTLGRPSAFACLYD